MYRVKIQLTYISKRTRMSGSDEDMLGAGGAWNSLDSVLIGPYLWVFVLRAPLSSDSPVFLLSQPHTLK